MEEKRFDRAPETGRGASVRWRSRGLRSRKRTSDYPFRRRSCPRSTPSGFRPLTGATSGRASASSPRVFSGARADLPSRPSAALPARPSTPCPHRPCHPLETLARYPRAPFMWADEGRPGTRRRFRKARCRANHRKKAFSTAFRRATATRPLAPFPTPHPPRLRPRRRDTTTNRSPRSRVDPRRRRVRVFPPPGACVSAPQLMDILGAVRRY